MQELSWRRRDAERGCRKDDESEMRDLKSSDVQAVSDDDLKKIIATGKGKMKPVANVTGASVDNVVAYVRSLKQ
jgi:hypothetical protein